MIRWETVAWQEALDLRGAVFALGTFDGVHRGHQAILARAREMAQRKGRPAAVLTFDRHPQATLRGKAPPEITPLPEKLAILRARGMAAAILLQFDAELANLPAPDFEREVLHESFGASGVVAGYNFTYGRRGEGRASSLVKAGGKYGFDVEVVAPVEVNGVVVSSTLIRQELAHGRVELAATLLGRYYALRGPVVPGDGRGRSLGFPTANLALPEGKLLPEEGVYLGLAGLDRDLWPALVSLGPRLTFQAGPAVEVHLIDFRGNLYGKELTVHLVRRLRALFRFPSAEALRARMEEDLAEARELFSRLHPNALMLE